MIGVLASESERPWVEEFFQLFKTPWEPAADGRRYRILLIADGRAAEVPADLTLVYGSRELASDRQAGMTVTFTAEPVDLSWGDERVPAYGTVASFAGAQGGVLSTATGAVDYMAKCGAATVRRVGYDLFQEIARLLTKGQPASRAAKPTLELHIALLKHYIEASGISYLEVPPRPLGADFTCCLTHDIDFFGIRRHRGDFTLAGFVSRGTAGTVLDLVRGRRPLAEAWRNLRAVVSLPLVLLGVLRDFWQPFEDYGRADRGLPSTFFIVPFRDHAGVGPDGRTRERRAVRYGARDIQKEMRSANLPRSEFALHGLDAWHDSAAGRAEQHELAAATGGRSTGVRMHWLYFSDASPRHIEDAGFDYDSTYGYNDTVGYRAGTMQAFRLASCESVLELPLTVMDTALFYPDYLDLDRAQALRRCQAVMDDATRFGGAMVVNWHDRSLVPERQWQRAYEQLLDQLERRPVWFATAGDAVRWFRWRRAIRFTADSASDDTVIEGPPVPAGFPGGSLVVRRPGHPTAAGEMPFSGGRTALRM